MRNFSKYCIGMAALAALGTAAHAAEPSYDELKQQLDQLKTRLDQVEARSAITTQDVDQTVERVLNDADHRSQFLQAEGFTAGWTKDKGFRIQDAAGNWSLSPFFQFQLRSVTNYRNDGKHGGSDNDWENGLELRRMKIGFTGNAFSPQLTYYFRWNTVDGGTNTGNLSLEEAWVRYQFGDDWAFRAGQITNPVFHEQTVSSSKQLTVERTLANQLITGTNQAYVQALTLQYDHKGAPITAEFGIEDGFNSVNTDFRDPNEGGNSDWGAMARVNWFLAGDRKAYDDFTALGVKNDLLVVGAGVDVTQIGDVTNYLHTADIQWKNTTGLALYAGYLANYIKNTGADTDTYNWGFVTQASYLLNDKWEVFGRYDYTNLDTSGNDEFCELAVGANWYFGGAHNGKVTVDLTYLPNGSPSDQAGLGILAGSDDELLLRAQLQLLL